ncbi:MAG: hypothetical protein ACI9ZH_001259, partial [Paracoccaceae bacterium]
MSNHHFWLSEAQFTRLQPLLPNKPRGVPRVDPVGHQRHHPCHPGRVDVARRSRRRWSARDLV